MEEQDWNNTGQEWPGLRLAQSAVIRAACAEQEEARRGGQRDQEREITGKWQAGERETGGRGGKRLAKGERKNKRQIKGRLERTGACRGGRRAGFGPNRGPSTSTSCLCYVRVRWKNPVAGDIGSSHRPDSAPSYLGTWEGTSYGRDGRSWQKGQECLHLQGAAGQPLLVTGQQMHQGQSHCLISVLPSCCQGQTSR